MISKKDISVFDERHRVLLQASEFICLRPHTNLREYISNYNITFPTKDIMPAGFTVMPSGCATLTIVNDSRMLFVDLDGPATKPYVVGRQDNQPEMVVTIEFRAAGLYVLTSINQSELTDKTMPFEAVNSKLAKLVSDVVEKAESVNELVTRLDMLLLKNVYTSHHPQLKPVFKNIFDCSGNTIVKRLADDIHYSERQLNRIFKQHVGVGVKSFSRLIRINNTFRLLKKPYNSITLISDLAGFHDLSHFVRDFKLVCGITPQEYRDNMSDFYINPVKF